MIASTFGMLLNYRAAMPRMRIDRLEEGVSGRLQPQMPIGSGAVDSTISRVKTIRIERNATYTLWEKAGGPFA